MPPNFCTQQKKTIKSHEIVLDLFALDGKKRPKFIFPRKCATVGGVRSQKCGRMKIGRDHDSIKILINTSIGLYLEKENWGINH